VIGNLYSRDGINLIIRNILANPCIRYLIVCGADTSRSGAALLSFFANGVGEDWTVLGDGTRIDPEIPREALDLLRQSVKIIDLRGVHDPGRIRSLLETLPPLPPFADPMLFPETRPVSETLPAEETGMLVRGPTVAEVWLRAVAAVMRFGQEDATPYASRQKEILDLVAIVEDEDPDNPALPAWLPIRQDHLSAYMEQFLTPHHFPDVSYTYGERLFAWNGIDQVQAMVNDLQQTHYSRRAIACLWDPQVDGRSVFPPCLITVQVRWRHDRLTLTAYFRSHDIYRAWLQNIVALRRLQALIARGVGATQVGHLVAISHSAHIYEDCWEEARRVLDEQAHILNRTPRFVRDPRGSFAIQVANGHIIVDHFSTDGLRLGRVEATTAQDIMRHLRDLVSRIDHALYLGAELEKAELALTQGWRYVQDRPLLPQSPRDDGQKATTGENTAP